MTITLIASTSDSSYVESLQTVVNALERKGHKMHSDCVPSFDCNRRCKLLHKFSKRKPCGLSVPLVANAFATCFHNLSCLTDRDVLKLCADLYSIDGSFHFVELNDASTNSCLVLTPIGDVKCRPSLADHSFDSQREIPRKSIVRFNLPFSRQLNVGFHSIVEKHFAELPIAARMCWSVRPNLFRQTYKFNFPRSVLTC